MDETATDEECPGIGTLTWRAKYRRYTDDGKAERTVADTWRRVAHALAQAEVPAQRAEWEQRFYATLENFRFLPGGRILAGAGTAQRVTLFNCFVMGELDDSLDGIFDGLKEGALTMQQGGGVGYDFSTLRPGGIPARNSGVVASGPVSFMRIWDAMCATILSTGARRGAMMATLRCDHPDIEDFIAAKHAAGELRHFNLSVLVTDDFMDAVGHDAEWPLVFPLAEAGAETVMREWPGASNPRACTVLRRVRARALWDAIMRANYDYAEPGVIFIDRVQRLDNLYYCERISATNPCGEIPLPPYGACDLGSINLTQFVREPFTPRARLDLDTIADTAAVAARLLDNVYEVANFPLPAQRDTARSSRRIGLGITGLADALLMLGVRYDSAQARDVAAQAMRTICHSAWRASVAAAREKGAFPLFAADPYLRGEFVRALPPDIRDAIAAHGIRNSHLTAIAPAGTISLLADNVSSGIEPIFAARFQRNARLASGEVQTLEVADYACRRYRELKHDAEALPPALVTATGIAPQAQIALQAALQPYVDNAISKTVNVAEDIGFDAFKSVYEDAYASGLKGCTTFRPNPVTGAILIAEPAPPAHCCSVEREAD
ncbi:MAG TPA: adenosylcobalamin-dependent ribonucleoside-diphosphate reductase [Burkholderiales bacterium]|nr:adenosylcobalamin-dependent ribonucleoside-diphosphate reductase [Burkholderiales bacterium]